MSKSLRPLDCITPGSSVHGIRQARILEWAVMPFSTVSSPPRDQTMTVGVIVWLASTTRTLIRVIQIIARTCILGLVSLEPSSLEASHHTFKKPRLGYWNMWDPGGMMAILDLPPLSLPGSQVNAAVSGCEAEELSSWAQSTHRLLRNKASFLFLNF